MIKIRNLIGGVVMVFWLTPVLSLSQVRVEEKPVPPREQLKIPPKPGEGLVLIPGRWIWHRPTKMYAWLSPVWIEPPKGKTWSPGYWKPLRKGWVWVPGKWKNKKRFWEKNRS